MHVLPSAALLVLGAAILPSVSAAADLVSTPPTLTIDRSLYSPERFAWTGFTLGVVGGPGVVTAPAAAGNLSIGVKGGYDLQTGPFVLGGSLDANYTPGTRYKLTSTASLEQGFQADAKLRAGYAFDTVLLYGTAGLAVARLDAKGAVTPSSQWVPGLAFGVGAEYAFTRAISGSLEYDQTRFAVTTAVGGVSRNDTLVGHAVKAGLNFHF